MGPICLLVFFLVFADCKSLHSHQVGHLDPDGAGATARQTPVNPTGTYPATIFAAPWAVLVDGVSGSLTFTLGDNKKTALGKLTLDTKPPQSEDLSRIIFDRMTTDTPWYISFYRNSTGQKFHALMAYSTNEMHGHMEDPKVKWGLRFDAVQNGGAQPQEPLGDWVILSHDSPALLSLTTTATTTTNFLQLQHSRSREDPSTDTTTTTTTTAPDPSTTAPVSGFTYTGDGKTFPALGPDGQVVTGPTLTPQPLDRFTLSYRYKAWFIEFYVPHLSQTVSGIVNTAGDGLYGHVMTDGKLYPATFSATRRTSFYQNPPSLPPVLGVWTTLANTQMGLFTLEASSVTHLINGAFALNASTPIPHVLPKTYQDVNNFRFINQNDAFYITFDRVNSKTQLEESYYALIRGDYKSIHGSFVVSGTDPSQSFDAI